MRNEASENCALLAALGESIDMCGELVIASIASGLSEKDRGKYADLTCTCTILEYCTLYLRSSILSCKQ